MDSATQANVTGSATAGPDKLFPKPPFTNSEFLLGQNSCGEWIAQDKSHRCGGVFADRNEALKYALSMNGNRMQAVTFVCELLELDFGTPHQCQQ